MEATFSFGDREPITLDFSKKESYFYIYHAAWAAWHIWRSVRHDSLREKHTKWIQDEFEVKVFKKRLDDDPPI